MKNQELKKLEKSLKFWYNIYVIKRNNSKIICCIYNEEKPPSTVAIRCKRRPTFGKAKVPPKSQKAGKNVRLADLNATGDQTSKCSDKQYKYEAKMSG